MEGEITIIISKEIHCMFIHHLGNSSLKFGHRRNWNQKTFISIINTINTTPILFLITFIKNLLGLKVGQSFHSYYFILELLRFVAESFRYIKGSIINRELYRLVFIAFNSDGWIRSNDTSGSEALWDKTKTIALHLSHFRNLRTGSQSHDC